MLLQQDLIVSNRAAESRFVNLLFSFIGDEASGWLLMHTIYYDNFRRETQHSPWHHDTNPSSVFDVTSLCVRSLNTSVMGRGSIQ